MSNLRGPQQVAKRALILGAVSFRWSLEFTEHHRVVEISERLLPWLNNLGCGEELDPIERELFETPFGRLSESQKMDARWAGEAAAMFCWMLKIGESPNLKSPADMLVLEKLCILRPEAVNFIESASLRPHAEIEDACRQFVLIRSMLQELRVEPPVRDIVRRVNVQRLTEVSVVVTDEAVMRAAHIVSTMTPQERIEVAGVYFVRYHAGLWFFGDRKSYF